VAETVSTWWARRQWSKGCEIPYPIGTYRSEWERYPVLIRQYHPDLNSMITLTQIPPAAEVYLIWQCDVGHIFVATPAEQRSRPGRERRRSTWCPECAALAVAKPVRAARVVPATSIASIAGDDSRNVVDAYDGCGHPRDPRRIDTPGEDRCPLCRRLDSSPVSREQLLSLVSDSQRADLANENSTARKYNWVCPAGHGTYALSIEWMLRGRRCRVCSNASAAADRFAVGDAFISPWAPKPASAAEAQLRALLAERFTFDLTPNAVKVARPFFQHVEVWPDLVLAELRVAIEYDTIGRHGLEHVGRREDVDRRKDRLLRAAGWEVIRIRVAKLLPLGPHDLVAAAVNPRLLSRIEEQLGAIRGELFVAAYRR